MSDVTQVHDRVAITVIRFLGSAAILGLLGVVFLVFQATQSDNQIDPSTVALVAGVSTLAGSALGALGSILASTSPKTAPQPVTVTNPPSDPVVTADVTAGANPGVTLASNGAITYDTAIHPDAPEESDL